MEPDNKSSVLTALVTCLTCGLAVILFGLMIYQCYTYPDQTSAFLSQAWDYISTELSFVGTAAHFIWFVVTYPFIYAFKAIIGATAIFWISFFCLYLWCSCIAHHLQRKGITSDIYKGFDTAANILGCWLVLLLYIACFGLEETLMSMFLLTAVLVVKLAFWAHSSDVKAAKERALAAEKPEPVAATEVV